MQVERIAETARRSGWATRVSCERRPTARRNARTPPCPGASRRPPRSPHASVVQRIALHGGKQTDASQAEQLEARSARDARVGGGRVEHEEPDEARGMPRDRAAPPKPRRPGRWRSALPGRRRGDRVPAPTGRRGLRSSRESPIRAWRRCRQPTAARRRPLSTERRRRIAPRRSGCGVVREALHRSATAGVMPRALHRSLHAVGNRGLDAEQHNARHQEVPPEILASLLIFRRERTRRRLRRD